MYALLVTKRLSDRAVSNSMTAAQARMMMNDNRRGVYLEMIENDFMKIISPDQRLELQVSPAMGGSIISFTCKQGDQIFDIMRGYDRTREASPLQCASFPLTPFSNRIGYGRLTFEGRDYEITTPFMSGDHPNHGDGFMSAWQVMDHQAHQLKIVLESETPPYRYRAEQIFQLTNQGLAIGITICNKAAIRLPYGMGHHAYFPRTEETILKLNAPQVWRSRNMLPVALENVPAKMDFSQGLSLSAQNLEPKEAGDSGTAYIDHCFQGWDQRAEIQWPEKNMKLEILADPVFENFVVYIPSDDNFFCAEPVTNVTDGFNLHEKGVPHTGTIILEPGQVMSGVVHFNPARLKP